MIESHGSKDSDTVKAQGQSNPFCPRDLHGTAVCMGHGLTMSCQAQLKPMGSYTSTPSFEGMFSFTSEDSPLHFRTQSPTNGQIIWTGQTLKVHQYWRPPPPTQITRTTRSPTLLLSCLVIIMSFPQSETHAFTHSASNFS